MNERKILFNLLIATIMVVGSFASTSKANTIPKDTASNTKDNQDKRPLLGHHPFTKKEVDSINSELSRRIYEANSNREKTVAAATFMVEFPYSIPYAYESYGYKLVGRYTEKGLFLNDIHLDGKVYPAWGREVTKPLNPLDNVFKNKLNLGNTYANGLHCSSFIGWCLYNAGVADAALLDKIFADQYAHFPGSKKVVLNDALCEIRAGDLLWFPGHVAIVIKVNGGEVKYAESALFENNHAHPENGLRWRTFNRFSQDYEKFRFKYLIKMEGVYN